MNKACESVSQTDFNTFKSNVYTKSDTEAYTTEEKNKLSGISEGANKTVIDTTLSSISTNPVQNKVIKTSLDSKANSSDVYTKTESDSRFLGVEGTAKKAVADENGKNISESFATDKNNIALNRTTLGTQCKNLLKNNAVTQTVSGVTFTINDDKSITVNGTATAQISFVINNKVELGIGDYILTGCPSGGSWDTFYLTAYASSAWLSTPDFGSGCKIENKTITQVVITIASGYTANNLKFYPILRDADITDDTYEPYQPSLYERIVSLEERISALEGGV